MTSRRQHVPHSTQDASLTDDGIAVKTAFLGASLASVEEQSHGC